MDNSPTTTRDSWSTPTTVVAATAFGGAALLAAGWLSALDPGGRVLLTVAALVMLIYAAIGARVRPRLAVDGDDLVLGGLTGTRRVARGQIVSIVVTRTVRIVSRSTLLEIDFLDAGGNERMRVLSRWDLGTTPDEVCDRLDEIGFVPPRELTAS